MTLITMRCCSLLLFLAVVGTTVAEYLKEHESSSPHLPMCKVMTAATIPWYHRDEQCDRAAHNSYQKRLLRASRVESLLPTGVAHIPNQQTVVCPIQAESLQSYHGHDTKWLVENKSKGPIVMAFVSNGIEYSAMNPTVTPPQMDPAAIMQPGSWNAIHTFEGHVFHVRELKPNGQLGNILLQHRPGFVGFTNRYGHELNCNHLVEDLEPLVEVEQVVNDETIVTVQSDPEYTRPPNNPDELCNGVYQGFRNMLPNCPLNIYYIGMQEPPIDEKTCQEEYKFHLGLEDMTEDYMFDWVSRTKFEATMAGHTFVARLAHPQTPEEALMVVDSFTLLPTEIYDCPELSESESVTASSAQIGIQANILEPLGMWDSFGSSNHSDMMKTMTASSGRYYKSTQQHGGNQTKLLAMTSSM